MKPTLQPGLEAQARFDVDRERTIDFMGEAARVYATPMLVRDIEMTCRNLLLAHLDAGEDSVGTRVEIDHIGATLLGAAGAAGAAQTDRWKRRTLEFIVSCVAEAAAAGG